MELPTDKTTSLKVSETDFRLIPKFIQSKRAILNSMNNDHCSFGYAIVLFYHPSEWKYRFKSLISDRLKLRFSEHKLEQIKYPVQIGDIPAIEDKLNLRINVFTFDDPTGYKRHSLYISKKYKPEEINLLYWEGRFAWIKFFSRLFHDITKSVFESQVRLDIIYILYIFLAINAKYIYAQGVWITSTTNGLFMIICRAVLMK